MAHDPEITPYTDQLSLHSLMWLLATYTQRVILTNEMGDDVASANGCRWADAFEFKLPKALVLAEVNRMAQWCLTHEAEVEAAQIDDLLQQHEDVANG